MTLARSPMLAATSPASPHPPGLLAVLDRLPDPPRPFTLADVSAAVRSVRAAGLDAPTADDALAELSRAELVRRAPPLDSPELSGPAYLVDAMARPL